MRSTLKTEDNKISRKCD